MSRWETDSVQVEKLCLRVSDLDISLSHVWDTGTAANMEGQLLQKVADSLKEQADSNRYVASQTKLSRVIQSIERVSGTSFIQTKAWLRSMELAYIDLDGNDADIAEVIKGTLVGKIRESVDDFYLEHTEMRDVHEENGITFKQVTKPTWKATKAYIEKTFLPDNELQQ